MSQTAAKESLGFDDFDDDLSDLSDMTPVDKGKLDRDEMRRVQKETGFDRPVMQPEKGWNGEGQGKKEPLKSVQFRLPESEIDTFHEAAYAEFGLKHGAKTDLFRMMWRLYQESKNS